MNITEAKKMLGYLAASEGKAIVYFVIDGKSMPLVKDAKPMAASVALEQVQICQETAASFGKRVSFSIARWEG